ncbi:hypothetical protein Poli38472_002666 [Pythium oligandrum]|uniref:[phosphatase 2A protein]-leucine-carboxy methyltransferase n=1 Tax=Pythium oligandrum TaxID=41045 RepID=A0A8K1CJ99_PYTOL|nr:hypothetical protein Poli38472_002666 [Pythium oligandrum]|eukprot:TMW63725.1 hypothetical protein Poli38472_002666 [Pythium oligandrum]
MAPTTSDHNVTETAFDAVKCKLSAVTLGYFEDPFLTHFVAKPTRRIPLIHRGYYLRHVAISDCVNRFLDASSDSPSVQIVSLGAGFDTLFFRLMQQHKTKLRFVEVDCEEIVRAKTEILRDSNRFATLLPLGVATESPSAAFECRVPSQASEYTLVSCDLGDLSRLEVSLAAARIDFSMPTLIIAECVVSYLEPTRGSALLEWLATRFHNATAVMYDPVSLNDTFGQTQQSYFAVKGCELRGVRAFQTPYDHIQRLMRQCKWTSCRLVDMNTVFDVGTTREEKRRIQSLEVFDEYADWVLCNAHYAMYIAVSRSQSSISAHWSDRFCEAHGTFASVVPSPGAPLLVRTFQPQDLEAVQKLFQSTHLEYSCKAVKRFVQNRVRSGDLADVNAAFLVEPRSHFWVVESDAQEIIGCIGLKPRSASEGATDSTLKTAELCRLSVHKNWRRRGVASLLVNTLEQFARVNRYNGIYLETIESMKSAQQFYAARGYEEAAQRVKFSTFTLVSFSKQLA